MAPPRGQGWHLQVSSHIAESYENEEEEELVQPVTRAMGVYQAGPAPEGG